VSTPNGGITWHLVHGDVGVARNRWGVVGSRQYVFVASMGAGARCGSYVRDSIFGIPFPVVDARTLEEAFTHMGSVVPILIVVVFWVLVGIFAVAIFRRWLNLPSETEIEAGHGHATQQDTLEQTVAH